MRVLPKFAAANQLCTVFVSAQDLSSPPIQFKLPERCGTAVVFFYMNHASDQHKEDLAHGPAIEKIRELVSSTSVCLFGTAPGHFPLTVRPMGVRDVDVAGNLWFLSGRSSLKNAHIAREPRVQLFFTDVGDSEYLSLEGFASISDNRALKEKYWTPLAKAWVDGGVDDPDLTVIKVIVTGGYYWDTEHGKAISLLKTAAAAVTGGKISDGGIEGSILP